LDKRQKEQQVEYITDKFEKAKSVIFADYRGLNVSQMTDLRRRLGQAASTIKVIKNRLVKRAAKMKSIEGMDAFFTGPTAMAVSEKDPVQVAKVMVEFAKEHELLKIKAGYMDGKVIDIATINRLASLPSREVLLGKMLGSMMAPASNLAGLLHALPRRLVSVINAIKEKKQ